MRGRLEDLASSDDEHPSDCGGYAGASRETLGDRSTAPQAVGRLVTNAGSSPLAHRSGKVSREPGKGDGKGRATLPLKPGIVDM